MTRKQRSALFFTCLFLFILTSLIAIFYSQGYRFNFRERKITQSGALYFKVIPKNAQVIIDGKTKKKTDIIFGTAFIDDLIPKAYNVKIKKDGYFTWEKNLEIKEKQVTEAKNIVLFSAELPFNVLSKNVIDFFLSPDEKQLLTIETAKESWELKLYNLKTGVKRHLLSKDILTKQKADFLKLEFSPDSKKIILKIALQRENKYFLIDLEQEPGTLQFLTELDFLGKNPERVSFSPQKNPQNGEDLFSLKSGKLSKADVIKKKIASPSINNVLNWNFYDSGLYYLDKEGSFYKTDLDFSTKEKINSANFQIKNGFKYEIISLNEFLFLKEKDDLYLFNPESKNFERFFEKTREIKISPDYGKAVYWSNSEIWILFLKNQENQSQKASGEKLFLTRFSQIIKGVSWLNSSYLIFNVGDKIKIAEIDDRDQINIIDLAEFQDSKLIFNKNNQRIYLLRTEELFTSEPLIK